MSPLRQFLLPRERRRDDAPAPHRYVPLGVRSHVAWHQMELDRELAAGTSPAASPEHRTRARQLLSVHVRRELAGCVERVLARSARPPHWHSTALPIQAAAVQAGRPELERLRAALLDDHCSSCRGVALASLLLHDDHSPVYLAGTGTSVTALARAAVVALESGEFEPTH